MLFALTNGLRSGYSDHYCLLEFPTLRQSVSLFVPLSSLLPKFPKSIPQYPPCPVIAFWHGQYIVGLDNNFHSLQAFLPVRLVAPGPSPWSRLDQS